MISEVAGHYRILSALGSGGMGVVYRAEDLKLGRLVAVKFLADSLAEDPTLRDRFLQEARAAASLNHPNICTVYEINDHGPRPFLVMELLEGETLQQRLAAGPLPTPALLDIAIQVADALEAAHARNLVHRDIKPGNVFLMRDGRVKVVDFGLAKPERRAPSRDNQSNIETDVSPDFVVTRPGTTLGTVAYMSPEQARAEDIDARSDLFSLGAVLYEMATGRRAFDGATAAVVFDGILNRMPPAPSTLNPSVPHELERIIGHALDKDCAARYQHASDLAVDLRRLRRSSDPEILAVAEAFGATAEPVPSPAWGTTPARPVPAAAPRRRWWGVAASLVLVAGVAAGALWWRFAQARPVGEGAPVLVADVENRTGDADFDATLKQAVTIKLEESPYLRVLSPPKVREMLALTARKADEPVTAAVARDMCTRMASGALVTGEIARLGSNYVLTLSAESCASGEEITREQVEVARKEAVLTSLGRVLSSMRARLGESIGSIRAHDKPMVEATTSSLAALKSFTLGDAKREAGVDLDSIPFYLRAVDLDPQFALAYARLGTVYSNTGEKARAREYYQKAYDLRDRASDRERLYIISHYHRAVTGDLAKARQVYEAWLQTYPHDSVPAQNLGVVYEQEGDLEHALASFRRASELDPRNRLARDTIAETLMGLGRFAEARREAERAVADFGSAPSAHLLLYKLDYLMGDRAAMAEHAKALIGTPAEMDRATTDYQIAILEGRFADGDTLAEQVAASAASQGLAEVAQGVEAARLVDRARAGFAARVRADTGRLLAAKPGDTVTLQAAFALLIAGDVTRARSVAAPLWPRIQNEPTVARLLRPSFDALVELQQGRPARAVELLKPTEPWEGRMKEVLISADVRGLAYLALRDGKSAQVEFAKHLAYPGIAAMDFSHVLARVYVARSLALAGDVAGARKAYDEFFALWKNADADVPLLQQARADYARLPAVTSAP